MDRVRLLTVLFLILNLFEHPKGVVGRLLKKKKKRGFSGNGNGNSDARIAVQNRKGGKKSIDDSLFEAATQVGDSGTKSKKGKKDEKTKNGSEKCHSGTKKKKKKSKSSELSDIDVEECIDEPTISPTEVPTSLPTVTPTATPSTLVPTSASTLSLKSKKSKAKSKKEKSRKTGRKKKKGSQSGIDEASDNRKIVGWFASIQHLESPMGTSSSTERPTDIEHQTVETSVAPIPQERFGPKPTPSSGAPVLFEPTPISPELYFKHPPEIYLEMPRASSSSIPASPSFAPTSYISSVGVPSAVPLGLLESQEDMTSAPVPRLTLVSNPPTTSPVLSSSPISPSIASVQMIRIGVPSFHITFSNSFSSPSPDHLNQVAELTISYIDDYFDNTFSLVDVTSFDKVLGTRTHVGTDGAAMEFLLAADFLSSSQFLPSSSDLLILLQTAFSQPALQTFIIMMRNLPENNPFHLVDAVSFSIGSISNELRPATETKSSESDGNHHVLTGTVFATFAIAVFVAVCRWRSGSSKNSSLTGKPSRRRVDSDPHSITEQSLYRYSGIDKEEEEEVSIIEFHSLEQSSPQRSVGNDSLFVESDTDKTEVTTSLPTIREDDDGLSLPTEKSEIALPQSLQHSSLKEHSISSSCTGETSLASAEDATVDSLPDSSSSSDDVSFGSSTVGSLLFEDDESSDKWDNV